MVLMCCRVSLASTKRSFSSLGAADAQAAAPKRSLSSSICFTIPEDVRNSLHETLQTIMNVYEIMLHVCRKDVNILSRKKSHNHETICVVNYCLTYTSKTYTVFRTVILKSFHIKLFCFCSGSGILLCNAIILITLKVLWVRIQSCDILPLGLLTG